MEDFLLPIPLNKGKCHPTPTGCRDLQSDNMFDMATPFPETFVVAAIPGPKAELFLFCDFPAVIATLEGRSACNPVNQTVPSHYGPYLFCLIM